MCCFHDKPGSEVIYLLRNVVHSALPFTRISLSKCDSATHNTSQPSARIHLAIGAHRFIKVFSPDLYLSLFFLQPKSQKKTAAPSFNSAFTTKKRFHDTHNPPIVKEPSPQVTLISFRTGSRTVSLSTSSPLHTLSTVQSQWRTKNPSPTPLPKPLPRLAKNCSLARPSRPRWHRLTG